MLPLNKFRKKCFCSYFNSGIGRWKVNLKFLQLLMKVEKEVKVLSSKLWFFFPFSFCLSSILPSLPSFPPSFLVAFLFLLKLINSVSPQTHAQFKITTINLSTSWKISENFEISPLTPCYHQEDSSQCCEIHNLNYPCAPEAGVKNMLKTQGEQSHSSPACLYSHLWREDLFFEVDATLLHETKSLIEMRGGEKRWEVLWWRSIT